MKSNYDQSSLLYYPEYVTVKLLTDAVKQIRSEKRSLVRIPQHLPRRPFQDFNYFKSEMTIDWRDSASRMKAKYNDPDDSLNATVAVLKHAPQFIHRGTEDNYGMSLHHLVH